MSIPMGKILDMGDTKLVKVLVTPKVAAQWLKHGNPLNRNIRENTAKSYAADIQSAMWDGDAVCPIVFDWNEVLRDGHHRLNAIILANAPVECWVVLNAPPSNTYDLNAGRSVNDKLKMDGIQSSNIGTALIRAIGSFCFGITKVSVGEIQKAYEVDGVAIHDVCNAAARGTNNNICRKASVVSAMYCAYKTGYCTLEQLAEFAEIVNTGIPKNVEQIAPIIFRNQFLAQRTNYYGTLPGRKQCFRATQEAIIYFVENKSRKQSFRGCSTIEKEFIKRFNNGNLFGGDV